MCVCVYMPISFPNLLFLLNQFLCKGSSYPHSMIKSIISLILKISLYNQFNSLPLLQSLLSEVLLLFPNNFTLSCRAVS